jgi:O-antigen/teichoic acid export membrane protein
MSVKRNIVANYVGQGWTGIMALAFIPLYIRYLGMEAYGLIGLFAVMQAWLTLLDIGMTPTLNREMARYTGGAHSAQSIGDLLRSLELLCFSLTAVIGFGVWVASDYLATDWLKAEKLPTPVVAQAIAVMAFVAAFRFVEGIYRGSLVGLQRQVWYNGFAAVLATLRYGGAVAVLAWVSPTVRAFFLWQGFISLLTVAVFAVKVHRTLPRPPRPARFSYEALAGVWRFAAGMMGISFLALLLTQVDKIVLSRLLTLESFGYYTLASTVAGVLIMIIVPLDNAIYPRMVVLSSQPGDRDLVTLYHEGMQLVTVLTAPAVMLLSVFAGGVIFAWSGNPRLADGVAPILSALVLGTFLNGLMHMPYQLQLAHGWTRLTIITNIVAVAILIPALLLVVPGYRAVGAAWIWVTLNAGYVLITVQFMHRRLIPREKWRWYVADVMLPVAGAAAVAALAWVFQPAMYESRVEWLAFLAVSGTLALVAAALLADRVRPRVAATIARLTSSGNRDLA